MKINLTNEELIEAKTLAKRLKEQDNKGIKLPIFFLLQDIEERRVFDCGDHVLFNDENGEIWRGEDEEDIIEQIFNERKEEIEYNVYDFSDEEIERKLKKLKDDIENEVVGETYNMEYEYITKHIFLTEEAAEQHLKSNHYHYKKPRIYVDHAWKNPEMELVYKILTSISD